MEKKIILDESLQFRKRYIYTYFKSGFLPPEILTQDNVIKPIHTAQHRFAIYNRARLTCKLSYITLEFITFV